MSAHALTLPDVPTIARVALALSLIAGGVSLARLDQGFAELGVFGEARTVGLLAIGTLAILSRGARHFENQGASQTGWLTGVVLLHGWVLASWAWSDRTATTADQATELVLTVAALLVTAWTCQGVAQAALRTIFWAFYVLASGLVTLSLAIAGGPAGGFQLLGAGGIGLARTFCMGVLAAWWIARDTGRRVWLMPVPLMIVGAVLSGSRAAVLALAAAAVAMAVLGGQRKVARRRLLAINAAGIALGLVTIATVPWIREAVGVGVRLLLNPNVQESSSRGVYLADRDVIFADALSQFASYPFLGRGIGSYVGPFGELYPHNLLLSFGVDAGVLALGGSIALLAIGFLKVASFDRSRSQLACVGAVFFFVTSMFAGSYYDARFLWIFLLLGALDSARKTGIQGSLVLGRTMVVPQKLAREQADRVVGS